MKTVKFLMKNLILSCLLLVFLLSTDLEAQSNSIKKITKNKYALDNLIAGLKSENCSIKRNAIYLAGKYRIKEVKYVLLNQLKNENEPCTRILIAHVLYEMGYSDGLHTVKDLMQTNEDEKTRRMATQTYYEYLKNDNGAYVSRLFDNE
jgi:K+ transporter